MKPFITAIVTLALVLTVGCNYDYGKYGKDKSDSSQTNSQETMSSEESSSKNWGTASLFFCVWAKWIICERHVIGFFCKAALFVNYLAHLKPTLNKRFFAYRLSLLVEVVSFAETLNAPPLAIIFTISSPEYLLRVLLVVAVHSQTFPDVSNNPNGFGSFFPTEWWPRP